MGHLIGSGIVQCVNVSFPAVGSVDGVALDVGVAPSAVVECHWSLSLCGMVILGCMRGLVATGVGELQTSHPSSAVPSGCLRKPAKLAGNCGELPRSSKFVRSNCSTFCARLLGGHVTVDSGG